MATKDAAAPSISAIDRYEAVNKRMRDASRAFVLSLGTVAATLIAGLGLTRLDEVAPGRQTQALIAAVLAVSGVVLLLGINVMLASAGRVSVADLARVAQLSPASRKRSDAALAVAVELIEDPRNGLLGGHERFVTSDCGTGLLEAHQEAHRDLASRHATYVDSGDEAAALKRAMNHTRQLDRYYGATVALANTAALRHEFRRAVIRMGVAALISTVGIVWFVRVTQPAGAELHFLPAPPVAATLDVTPAAWPLIDGRLGPGCEVGPDGVPVTILGESDGVVDVLADAGEGCERVRLEVTDEVGLVTPAS